MALANSQHSLLLTYLGEQRTLPVLAVVALRVAVTVNKWATRRKTRVSLAKLDDHLLRDIGMDRRTAYVEARRKFWQG